MNIILFNTTFLLYHIMKQIITFILCFSFVSCVFSQPHEYLLPDPLETSQKFSVSSYFYSEAKGSKIEKKVLKKAIQIGKKLKLSKEDELDIFPNFVVIKKNDHYGIYTLNGKEILKCEYTYFYKYGDDDFFKIGKENLYGYFNSRVLTEIIPCKYQEIDLIRFPNDIRFKVNFSSYAEPSYGIIDEKQNIIAEEFQAIDYDSTSEWILAKKNDKWGYIDKDNVIKIPFEYDELNPFGKYKLAPARQGVFWGVINQNNQWVITPIYDDMMFAFQNELLRVKKDGLVGFVNTKGEIFIELKYKNADGYARSLSNVIRVVKTNGKIIILDATNGRELCEEGFDKMNKFNRAYNTAIVLKNGKYGLINNKCEVILPLEYDYIEDNISYLTLTKNNEETEVRFEELSIQEYEKTNKNF